MIYVSTNMLTEDNFDIIYDFVDDGVGIEIFPLWNQSFYAWTLMKEKNILKSIPTTFHGPYYGIEHSAPKGSVEYDFSMEQIIKTCNIAQELQSKYLVFHHNNTKIENKDEMLFHARENLIEINRLANEHDITVVVENAGVMAASNMLLQEEEFIKECLSISNPVLLDIGHVNCNNWNLEYVISELAEKICAYHVHNNDGVHDAHKRIYEGTLNFDTFLSLAKKYTPNADMTIEYARTEAADKKGILEDIKKLKNFGW